MAQTSTRRAKQTRKIANLEDKIFRLLGMVLFAMLLNFIFVGFLVLITVQYFLYLIEDKPNEDLDRFIRKVRTYIAQIFSYLGFATEDMPFPFQAFPKK